MARIKSEFMLRERLREFFHYARRPSMTATEIVSKFNIENSEKMKRQQSYMIG